MPGVGITDLLTALQNGVTAANNLAQLLTQATVNSSSLRVQISGVSTTSGSTSSGTVTTINTSIGLTGGPITTTGTLAVSITTLANSISSDVLLNNTASYFDGPTVAQGSSGKFFASGTVTLGDTAGSANFFCKLWDGTNVIASGDQVQLNAGNFVTIALSGVITNPSGNIRMSARDPSSTNGKILANATGNAKDSTLSVMRIG